MYFYDKPAHCLPSRQKFAITVERVVVLAILGEILALSLACGSSSATQTPQSLSQVRVAGSQPRSKAPATQR
jgi:hypothetical protein